MGFSKPPGVPCPPNNPHCGGDVPSVPIDSLYFIIAMVIIAILIFAHKSGYIDKLRSHIWQNYNSK